MQTHAIVRYEEQMAALRAAFTGVFQDLVVSARSTPFTRRAILPHLPKMASVLGRRQISSPSSVCAAADPAHVNRLVTRAAPA